MGERIAILSATAVWLLNSSALHRRAYDFPVDFTAIFNQLNIDNT